MRYAFSTLLFEMIHIVAMFTLIIRCFRVSLRVDIDAAMLQRAIG